jgi:transcription initiation factor TFIIB
LCSACGIVLESHILDETPEWRNHAADGPSGGADRCRVGAANDSELGTYLDHHGSKRRVRHVAETRDQGLRDGLDAVNRLLSAFSLSSTSTVAHMARELFRDLHAVRPTRSDTRHAAAAAAVYFGCKLEGVGRELREICETCGVDLKSLNAASGEYKAHLYDKPYYPRLMATLQASELIGRYLDRLSLPRDQHLRARSAAHKLNDRLVDLMDSGRKPRTICSGLLFVALQSEHIDVNKVEFAKTCNVCTQTLDKVVPQILNLLATPRAPPSSARASAHSS